MGNDIQKGNSGGEVMKHDIVYVLKEDIAPDELRYSLRSVCKNFPYRKVIFIGGCPEGIMPDVWIQHEQKGVEVWEKSTSSVELACKTKEISDNFWLFNDDFFIMKPISELKPWYNGTIQKLIEAMSTRTGGHESLYMRRLIRTKDELRDMGLKEFNYAVHVPMLINKKKALEVIRKFKSPMFRSAYGNYWNVGKMNKPDVKEVRADAEPDKRLKIISTSDKSFREGKVGEYIRSVFTEPCRYEVGEIQFADSVEEDRS